MKSLSVSQLNKACDGNKYLLVRTMRGSLYGVNCALSKTLEVRSMHGNKRTSAVAFIPCGFDEYINYKLPFKAKVK